MKRNPSTLLALLAVGLIGQGVMQRTFVYPNWRKNYATNQNIASATGLSPDQFLFALAGFREMIAGILWVRADSFFDSGNYDGVLPIIRLVTILDPHQIDVFATGCWHIGYNFTDEDQRSDRRYLPSALALASEGARQNPHTYEMFFETGWLWYHKIQDDFEKAIPWFVDAVSKPDIKPARKNLLAKAYERNGQIDKMVETYYELLDESMAKYEKNHDYADRINVDTIENNLDTTLVRMAQRGFFAQKRGAYAQGAYDTKPPFDVGFSVKATVIEPNVIQLDGTWNVLPSGTRIRVVLRDKDYPQAEYAHMNWEGDGTVNLDPPKDRTWLQDELYARNRKLSKKIDMSRDPTMYPFRSGHYILEFYYNARVAPPHIQDKFGWNGEGMTDKNFMRDNLRKSAEGVPVQRCVYTSFELDQDQIKRRGEWIDNVPTFKTKNFVDFDTRSYEQDVIKVPTLRQ